MGWRTSVSSHVGVVLKQSLVAKAVAAAGFLGAMRPTAGGPGGRHQLVEGGPTTEENRTEVNPSLATTLRRPISSGQIATTSHTANPLERKQNKHPSDADFRSRAAKLSQIFDISEAHPGVTSVVFFGAKRADFRTLFGNQAG